MTPAETEARAQGRLRVLTPHLEDGVALRVAAAAGGVSVRTAERWLRSFRANGLAGLARRPRSDRGSRRIEADLVELVEHLADERRASSATQIHRQVLAAAARGGLPAPSYGTTCAIIRARQDGAGGGVPDSTEATQNRNVGPQTWVYDPGLDLAPMVVGPPPQKEPRECFHSYASARASSLLPLV